MYGGVVSVIGVRSRAGFVPFIEIGIDTVYLQYTQNAGSAWMHGCFGVHEGASTATAPLQACGGTDAPSVQVMSAKQAMWCTDVVPQDLIQPVKILAKGVLILALSGHAIVTVDYGCL